MKAAHYQDFERRSQAFDEELYPLTVTVGEVEIQAAGSHGMEVTEHLAEGGTVETLPIRFTVGKTAWTEAGLPTPYLGQLVTIGGVKLAIVRILGRQPLDVVWSLEAERSIER